MSDPFVDQLVSLCRTHVTRGKWVFVLSHAQGRRGCAAPRSAIRVRGLAGPEPWP